MEDIQTKTIDRPIRLRSAAAIELAADPPTRVWRFTTTSSSASSSPTPEQTLTSSDQSALLLAAPLVVGNLNGIPLTVRVQANRATLLSEIARHQRAIANLHADTEAGGGYKHGRVPGGQTNHAKIAEHQALIDQYTKLLNDEVTWYDEAERAHEYVGARVVVFDPSSKAIGTHHGALDPSTGDIPAWVKNVAVNVPGTGTNLLGSSDDKASLLYDPAGPSSAVFQWAGRRRIPSNDPRRDTVLVLERPRTSSR